MFTVDCRTNKYDIPTPAEEQLEWVIKEGNFLADAPAFPYTLAAKTDAERIVRLLNNTVRKTEQRTQRAIRDAIGL